jgi:CYTH domain-containing protein
MPDAVRGADAADKYARPEIERRWLVTSDVDALIAGAPCVEIEDRYITATRLRLRCVRSPAGATQYKLCKKYPKAPGDAFESITNIYLTADEFERLARLPAAVARKRRHRLAAGSLDVYSHPRRIAIFEMEFASAAEAAAFVAPAFAGREITGDESLSGAALAGT